MQNPQSPNQPNCVYHFASDNHDVRVFPPAHFDPFRVVDMSSPGSSHRRKLKSIPIVVGAGPPIVQEFPGNSRGNRHHRHSKGKGHRTVQAVYPAGRVREHLLFEDGQAFRIPSRFAVPGSGEGRRHGVLRPPNNPQRPVETRVWRTQLTGRTQRPQ